MYWDESKHPRDTKGRFTYREEIEKAKYIYNSDPGIIPLHLLPESYPLPDEQLPYSVGAQWKNYDISMPDGSVAHFVEGSKLQDKEVFAGRGCRRKIDCIDSLVKTYGGNPLKWAKVKAIAEIKLSSGEAEKSEIHWYEEPSIGKVEFKYKKRTETK